MLRSETPEGGEEEPKRNSINMIKEDMQVDDEKEKQNGRGRNRD